MALSEPTATYLELRESREGGEEGEGLSHRPGGLCLLHVRELAAFGEPRGGIAIVHDAGDHGGRYLAAAARLAEAGWAVALPDLRGHGRSEGERGHSAGPAEIARDLRAVEEHVAYRLPDAPRYLVGQGLGALHVVTHALRAPEPPAGLVLLAPLLAPRFQAPAGRKGLLKLFSRPRALSTGFSAEHMASDTAEQNAWSADELVHDSISEQAARFAREAAEELLGRWNELSMPVLVLHGTEDRIADPALTSRLARPGIEIALLEGRRHDLLHDRGAAEVIDLIVSWLARR
jgi:alpha-beta hydrolase superfamily lysophospholipase